MVVEARGAAVALRHRRTLAGILLGVSGARPLIGERQPQAFYKVDQEDAPQQFFDTHIMFAIILTHWPTKSNRISPRTHDWRLTSFASAPYNMGSVYLL